MVVVIEVGLINTTAKRSNIDVANIFWSVSANYCKSPCFLVILCCLPVCSDPFKTLNLLNKCLVSSLAGPRFLHHVSSRTTPTCSRKVTSPNWYKHSAPRSSPPTTTAELISARSTRMCYKHPARRLRGAISPQLDILIEKIHTQIREPRHWRIYWLPHATKVIPL